MVAWREATLGEVCDEVGGIIQTGPFGSQLHESDYSPEGIPVVMPRDIIEGRIASDTVSRVSHEHVDRLSRHKLRSGDIVYGRRGDIGRQALIRQAESGWLCGTGCLRLSLGESTLDPLFLHYYLRQDDVVGWISNQAVGATMPNLNTGILRSVPIRFPAVEEQRRIAGILSAYDELIENSQRRIRILETMARALYREWFVHFRFPGHENVPRVPSTLGDVPKGWEVRNVADAFEVSGGGTPSRKDATYWDGGTIQWFSPSDLTRAGTMFMDDSSDHITERGLAESSARLFPARSVMLTSRATIGAIAINTHEACTNQGFITCIPNDRVPLCFMYQWLGENVPTFQRMASGSTFKEISRGVFKTIEFVRPPADLVGRFESVARPMAEQALALQRQIQNLRRTRDLLLPRLLSGQVLSGKPDQESLQDRLPRVFELKETLSDPLHPDAYFQNFEPSLKTNQPKQEAFLRLERLLKRLDDPGWHDLKARAAAQLQKKDPIRGWQALFDTLGEAKGFVYLQKLGCTGVKFIPRPEKAKKMPKTPDLEAVHEGRTVLCEVKTINISQDEAQSRHRTSQGGSIAAEVSTRVRDPFLWKVRSKMEEAIEQLDAQDPRRVARRIVFTVVHFDDWVGDYLAEYFEQIDEALLKSPVSGAELVFSPAINLFNRIFSMRSATVFECA